MRNRLMLLMVGVIAVIALIVAGCAPEAAPPSEEEAPPAEEEEEEEAPPAAPEEEVVTWKGQAVTTATDNALWNNDTYQVNAIRDMSAGRLDIELHGAGALVPTSELLEAVETGTLECSFDHAIYWAGKDPAFGPITMMPFGMGPWDWNNWVWQGGGLELMQEVYGQYNIMYFPNWTNPMECGYRTNKPIESLEDFDGLKLRAGGIEVKEVLQEFGAELVFVEAAEIYTALERGIVDGLELGFPSYDWDFNIQEITKYWCLPGWHQPGTTHGFMVNMDEWNKLPDDLQSIVYHSIKSTWIQAQTDIDYHSAEACHLFEDETDIIITRLSADDLAELERVCIEVQERKAAENPLYAKIIKSQHDYLRMYELWRDLQGEYGVARKIADVKTPLD